MSIGKQLFTTKDWYFYDEIKMLGTHKNGFFVTSEIKDCQQKYIVQIVSS